MATDELTDIIPYAKQVHLLLREAGAYERAKDWLARRTTQDVLVLGASGAGKSSFLRLLTGENPKIARLDRTTNASNFEGKIENSYFRLIDTPGQPDEVYSEKRLAAIREAAGMKRLGIINVVAYGYHEETVKISDAVNGAIAREEFLAARRELEIALLSEWTNVLCGKGGAADWMITVVTKADLWYVAGADQPALFHYQRGPYFEALGSAREISHDLRPYSSQNQLFYDRVPMSGYYTDEQRAADHSKLIAQLLENTSR